MYLNLFFIQFVYLYLIARPHAGNRGFKDEKKKNMTSNFKDFAIYLICLKVTAKV